MDAAIWRAAAELAGADDPFAMATVSRQRGSLPMASDAKLLVTAAGRFAGTVGGGCVEADVMTQALATIETGRPEIVSHTLNADVAGDLGLSCGGTVDLFLEPLQPGAALQSLCGAVADGMAARKQVAVCTRLSSENRSSEKLAYCDEAVVATTDGSGFPAAAEIWERTGSNTFVHEEDDVFVERIPRQPRVLIFGAGHVGREIARLSAASGFHVLICDDRADFASAERVPEAHDVVVGDFSEVIGGLTLGPDDYVLATTRGHSFDATIVQLTAGSNAAYVGMLGSRRKKAVTFRALQEAGVPDSALQRVHCPIGLDIGADNPAEIAVSVVAELIRARRLDQLV